MAKTKKAPIKKPTHLITGRDLAKYHFRGNQYKTDLYYVKLANTMMPVITAVIGKVDFMTPQLMKRVALMLTCYVEDLVSGQGVWEAFIRLNRKRYGKDLPFYNTDDEFYSVEFPCVQAAKFLIWYTLGQEKSDEVLNPENIGISLLGNALTPILEVGYDGAPETPGRPQLRPEDEYGMPLFYQVRYICEWLCTSCYLTAINNLDDFRANYRSFFDSLAWKGNGGEKPEDDLVEYGVNSFMSYNAKIGPVGAYPYQWLAEMLESYCPDSEKIYIPLLRGIEGRPYAFYLYKKIGKNGAELEALSGETLDLSYETCPGGMLPPEVKKGMACFMSLVRFDGEYMLNSLALQLLPGMAFDDIRSEYLKKKNVQEEHYEGAMKYLKSRIGVFAGVDDYLRHFPDGEKLDKKSIPDDLKDATNILYFVNTDGNVNLYAEWGSCVKLPRNKFYDIKDAEDEAHCLIFDRNLTTAECREYLIENNLVPDATLSSQISVKEGKRMFQENIRFLNDYLSRDKMVLLSDDSNL